MCSTEAFRGSSPFFLWLVIIVAVTSLGMMTSPCHGQETDGPKNIDGMLKGADHFRRFLIELAQTVTGSGLYKSQPFLRVVKRSQNSLLELLTDTEAKVSALLKEKTEAVERLKQSAEDAMKAYGPYNPDITFQDVNYYNAKKVVTRSDISDMKENAQEAIMRQIQFLPTNSKWDFKPRFPNSLNIENSTIHVPTNIYDKSTIILNGVNWTRSMTPQFEENMQKDPTLRWQYFCSSDGFLRIYPGMQWPRDPDQVDTFDCRIRQWYIQAATSPKNILILLDSSGSMKGLRFSIAKSTVSKILETLSDKDYFNVLEFSGEPRYVDECFNGTFMPASEDNIKRMQSKIDVLAAKNYANFKKILTLAFQLYEKEQKRHDHAICNKAIMLITDGAPDNYDDIFGKFNWPNKTIRVFTYLIGKEVPDNRQARWMACANKGKFAHISTRADVQENVQKYIKVLSRPLAIHRAQHRVWSPVYLDYITQQSEIELSSELKPQLDLDNEVVANYQGLGLVMSISMPVFDSRPVDTEGATTHEQNSRNLLGVVGTDLRINEVIKLMPFYELGVNGYAFAITSHGYILFHPDYRPFMMKREHKGGMMKLKLRPKYNSVELSEVELPVSPTGQVEKEHSFHKYLLALRSGGHSMNTVAVLSHWDGMKRAKERKNVYEFRYVSGVFKLVFVVPSGYGSYYIQANKDRFPYRYPPEFAALKDELPNTYTFSSWVVCYNKTSKLYVKIKDLMQQILRNPEQNILSLCEADLAKNLLLDVNMTMQYYLSWVGVDRRCSRSKCGQDYAKEYDKICSLKPTLQEKVMCTLNVHSTTYGISVIWIGTRSGVTRYLTTRSFSQTMWEERHDQTTHAMYYQRAVDGWEDNFKYVYSGPVLNSPMERDLQNSWVTMQTVQLVGEQTKLPAAVVAFSMNYTHFYDNFVKYTFDCDKQDSCKYHCNDTHLFNCYLIDNNAYILATNNADHNGTGLFLGQYDATLMTALLDHQIFNELKLLDFQGMCKTPVKTGQESASSFISSPLRQVGRFIVWVISELVLLLTQWSAWGEAQAKTSAKQYNQQHMTVYEDDKKCGEWIAEDVARYLYCGFVINEMSGEKMETKIVSQFRACEQRVIRFTLNMTGVRKWKQRSTMGDCASQCNKSMPWFEVRWLKKTNLLFIVADANCLCKYNQSSTTTTASSITNDTSADEMDHIKYRFSIRPQEVHYDDAKRCQHLRNVSEDLKRVDWSANADTLCLDSSNEEDTPCGLSSAVTSSSLGEVTSVLLSLLVYLLGRVR